MFKDLAEFVKNLKGLRWYTIVFIFLSFILYSFNNEIVRIIDLEWSNKDLVIETLENDIAIDEALRDLMEDTSSDRAYIFRFHNGVQYYNGTHKSKMSCDYEVVKKGVSSEAQRLQDLPTGLYSRWIKTILKGDMYILDVDDMSDLRAKHILQEQGIEAVAVEAYYRNGKVFALIGVDYLEETSEEDYVKWSRTKEEQKMWFKGRTEEIGNLLL